MAKKNRHRGHFCEVCKKIMPNEKFSGKGPRSPYLQEIQRESKARKSEDIAITRIYSVYCHPKPFARRPRDAGETRPKLTRADSFDGTDRVRRFYKIPSNRAINHLPLENPAAHTRVTASDNVSTDIQKNTTPSTCTT